MPQLLKNGSLAPAGCLIPSVPGIYEQTLTTENSRDSTRVATLYHTHENTADPGAQVTRRHKPLRKQ